MRLMGARKPLGSASCSSCGIKPRSATSMRKALLQRRKLGRDGPQAESAAVFGTLQEITQGVANNNRQMFELNKIASTANAIINTAQGVTLALASYPPPISFAMAAVQLAAGLVQIQAIQSASFGGSTSPPSVGGGGATPTFQAPTVNTASGQAPQGPPYHRSLPRGE
jgi:hypothetical protein